MKPILDWLTKNHAALVRDLAALVAVLLSLFVAPHPLTLIFDPLLLGMLTLIVYRVPTGVRAWIHDVVVDEAAGPIAGGMASLSRAPFQRADGAEA